MEFTEDQLKLKESLLAYDEAIKAWNRYQSLHKQLEGLKAAFKLGRISGIHRRDAARRIWSISREIRQMEKAAFESINS